MTEKENSPQWVYGIHAVEALLKAGKRQVKQVYIQTGRRDSRVEQIRQLAEACGISIRLLDRQYLDKHLANAPHQGVAADCCPIAHWQEHDLDAWIEKHTGDTLILILDGIQDPHNLGACLRTANGAGVDWVIAGKHEAVGMTSTVRKVASGAAEVTPFVQVSNLARTLRKLKDAGIWLFAATDQAEQSLYQADLRGRTGIVLGAEGKGLRRITQEQCDYRVSIPMAGEVPSLNVSVAAGVCLYEAWRQRLK